jgi:serine O-acetyltransferase
MGSLKDSKSTPITSPWQTIRQEAQQSADHEPILASFLHATILNHKRLEDSLSFHLANKLDSPAASAMLVREVAQEAMTNDPSIIEAVIADILAVQQRDSACESLATPFLYFKGFHALQAYRIAHWLWNNNRRSLALFLQNRISEVFDVDIHPAAKIGKGLLIDHATGLVIGETAVVGDNVSIMQSVTLGGTGKEAGDRHPKVHDGVLIAAGAKILGNIIIGEGAMIAAGSVVLKPVSPHTLVAGVPAKAIGKPCSEMPALNMNQRLD